MKTRFVQKKLASFAMFLLLAIASTPAFSQGVSMKDIYAKGETLLNYLEDEYGYEVVHMEYDIITSSKTITRRLTTPYTYTIVGFADDRVKDLDIIVYQRKGNAWKEVKRDEEEDSTPVVSFKPTASGDYRIEIKVYKYNPGASAAHYGLIFSHDIP